MTGLNPGGARIAIAGATGAVGRAMIDTLKRRRFPVAAIRLMASSRSAGSRVQTPWGEVQVEELSSASFDGVDIALFSAGSGVSREEAPRAAAEGAVVIDNSSAFRMDEGVPLVVPEVNAHAISAGPGIIANPNCSTIQLMVVLAPIRDKAGLVSARVATYQAASGAGKKGVDELLAGTRQAQNGEPVEHAVHAGPLAFNCIPWIGSLDHDNYTNEELKLLHESRKILELPDLRVSATCVRVPVDTGHSEVAHIVTERHLSPDDCRDILSAADGVTVIDSTNPPRFPTPVMAAGQFETFVGRIRRDPVDDNGLVLWVVSDNLLKGAALNAVQIAEVVWQKREGNQ